MDATSPHTLDPLEERENEWGPPGATTWIGTCSCGWSARRSDGWSVTPQQATDHVYKEHARHVEREAQFITFRQVMLEKAPDTFTINDVRADLADAGISRYWHGQFLQRIVCRCPEGHRCPRFVQSTGEKVPNTVYDVEHMERVGAPVPTVAVYRRLDR